MCEPIDCRWGDWEHWGDCDKCGGQKRRFRHVVQQALRGGKICKPDASEEIVACPRRCHEKLYCSWAQWSLWGTCDSKCGEGSRTRERVLQVVPKSDLVDSRVLDGLSEFDAGHMEHKVRQLKEKTRSIETRRFQELVVAFAAGGISLMVGLLLFRFYHKRRVPQTRHDELVSRVASVPLMNSREH